MEQDNHEEQGPENDDNADKEADAYQHVKQAKKDDLQVTTTSVY